MCMYALWQLPVYHLSCKTYLATATCCFKSHSMCFVHADEGKQDKKPICSFIIMPPSLSL